MKRILLSVAMLVFVGGIVGASTGAFFSDTETSTGNTFTAGALDLKVDSVAHINGLVCFAGLWHPEATVEWVPGDEDTEGTLALVVDADVPAAIEEYNTENPANIPQAGTECEGTWVLSDLGPEHTFFNYGDLKPGDQGENTISLHVDNNDAYMCAIIDNVQSDDNLITEPEAEDGDITPAAGQGELHDELKFFIWEDDGDNIFEDTELENILVENETAEDSAGVYPLYTPLTGVFTGGETQYLGVYWCYGEFDRTGTDITCDGGPVTNLSQTDSLKADITFYIEQARNNSGFTCPQPEVVVVPETATLTLVKTVLGDTDGDPADTAWTLTATGPAVVSGVEGATTTTSVVVGVGAYTLTEAEIGGPLGFTQTSLSCSDGVLLGNVLTLANGDNAVCTFTNTENTLLTQ